ncbi:MAG: Non-specific serine/threonine protein kinase [Firmicutes bacterium]|nr:Non-specific serine/threonine protein kinase [Bacillota bacterium]
MFKHKLKGIVIHCSLAVGLLAVSLLPGIVQAQGVEKVVEGNNRFAIDLFQRVSTAQGGDNIFFSPLSLSTALSMTYAGSRGNTAKQMADTIHFGYGQEQFHQDYSRLLTAFSSDGKPYTLSMANALWGQDNYRFEQKFISLIDNYYGGGFNKVNFVTQREESRQQINQWVAEKTSDKIKELLRADDLSADTRLVLTNAIYFKGKWTLPFNSAETLLQPFYIRPDEKVEVGMMRQTEKFRYVDTDEVQLIELPYAGDELSMVVLLPKGSQGEFSNSLSTDKLQQWLAQSKEERVAVFLPKFKLAARYYLEEEKFLPAMGMIDAFSKQDADFSDITGAKDLYIAHVIHQAAIEVNEAGSEASAATAVVMDGKSFMPIFRADKPFLFMIMHKPTGAILFMGKVNNPEA